MAGIRVHISESLLDKYETNDLRIKLKAHFQDKRHGGSDIKEMHFPVLQYEAVIIYEESSVVDGVMRIEHTIDDKKVCIRRLPQCQIYHQLQTDLDSDMASIIQGCEIIDTLQHAIKLEMLYDKKRGTLVGFAGSWYQLEMAWTLIDNMMAQQKRMLLQNKLDELRYIRDINGKVRHSRSTGLPGSDEAENLSQLLLPLDHEPRRIKQRNRNSEEDLNALAVKAVESEHITEKSSASPSARQRKHKKTSLSEHAIEADKAVLKEIPHDELSLKQNQTRKKMKKVDEHDAPQSLLSYEIEHVAKKSPASPSARQRKHEKTSLSEHAIKVDKAVWKETPHDELSSQQNQSQKKTKMVAEHDAPQSFLLGELDLKSDHLNASCAGKEHTSKSSICQGGTYAVSSQMQHKVENDTLSNLPRHEELNGEQVRGLVVGKDVDDERCSMDNMDDSDGTPSLGLHGQGFAFPDQSLPSGAESNARQRDSTQNETFNYFASIKNEPVRKQRVQNGELIISKPVQDMYDSTEQDEDSVISMPLQDECLNMTFSADEKNPELEFMIGDIHVVVMRGNITKENSEGIVSESSNFLNNHDGIAKVIATAVGNQLQRECKDFIKKYKYLDTNKVTLTSAGGCLNDKVTCVLHAVGPVWNVKSSNDETFQHELNATYANCFQFAEERGLPSLSLPLISSGNSEVPFHLCVRSFIDGLLIFIDRLETRPHLKEIHLINSDLERTQLTIVILQQLLEMGIRQLTTEALENCEKKNRKKTTTTKPRRSNSLPRFHKRESVPTTKDNDEEAENISPSRGRSSSFSRRTNTKKVKERHLGQITSSSSTQTSRPASRTDVTLERSERDQDGSGSSLPTRTDKDSQPASTGSPFSVGSSLTREKSTGCSSTRTRPASKTGVTSERSERDQDGSGSSFSSRTGRDGQSTSGVRPFSAGPSLKSQKSTRSSKSQTGPQDGGSVGQTKSPPLIKQSLFSQEPTAASKKKEIGHLKKEIAAKAKSQPLKAVHDSQDSDSNMESSRSPRGDNSDDSLGSPRDATSEKMFARRDLKPPEHMFSSLLLDLEKPSHKSNSRMAATLPLGLSQRHVEERDTDTVCPICLELMPKPKSLPKCNHKFCSACIAKYFKTCKPVCPQCGCVYGVIKGDQPKGGKMTYKTDKDLTVPGYEDAEGTIIITYDIPGGKQEDHHPRPGQMYNGLYRSAYVPNCSEGRLVLKLLQRAFDAGLIFTVGESKTTGRGNMITWNDIHHKTSIHGGSTNYGYPDPTYLQRVQEELAAKGITKDMV